MDMLFNKAEVIGTVIQVSFHTNLVCKYRCWYFPKKLCKIPEVGDCVETNERTLRVCDIIHKQLEDGTPYLSVELVSR